LIGQKSAIVLERLAWAFSTIEKRGWELVLDGLLEEGKFILDLDISAFGVKEFKIPDKYKKRK